MPDARQGDCVELMREMDEASVDAIVTDPPYSLGFMGKAWDKNLNHGPWATEALRVLKPGGHLLAFGGTRTFHRLTCALEDAGLEIRDCLSWLYGQGFPKSHNLNGDWDGWGTALKPAWEPIILARKPLSGTIAQTVLEHGTGALDVDGCRVGTTTSSGRWPANVLLDEESAALLDEQSGELKSPKPYERGSGPTGNPRIYGNGAGIPMWSAEGNYGDSGGASRFFLTVSPDTSDQTRFRYQSKASRAERNAGLEGFEEQELSEYRVRKVNATRRDNGSSPPKSAQNTHPTVKPIALMRWLCRLVTPPGGLILDPFMGSGTTGCAAVLEGFDFIGIEREAEFIAIAEARIAHWSKQQLELA